MENPEALSRIADSLERIANAAETLVLMAQIFASEEESSPKGDTIMTQSGPVEIR